MADPDTSTITVGGLVRDALTPPLDSSVSSRLSGHGIHEDTPAAGATIVDLVCSQLAQAVSSLPDADVIPLFAHFGRFDGTGSKPARFAGSTDQAHEELAEAAIAYEKQFGFPPVVRVAGRTAEDVTRILRGALGTTRDQEIGRNRAAVADIFQEKIRKLAATP